MPQVARLMAIESPARPRSTSSFDVPNALTINPMLQKLLRSGQKVDLPTWVCRLSSASLLPTSLSYIVRRETKFLICIDLSERNID